MNAKADLTDDAACPSAGIAMADLGTGHIDMQPGVIVACERKQVLSHWFAESRDRNRNRQRQHINDMRQRDRQRQRQKDVGE